MKRFLIYLLMLLMLMPGLACGPFMGAGKAQAAQTMQGMKDCPGMGGGSSTKSSNSGDHVFFKDCMKTDLCGVDHTPLKTPDLHGKAFFSAWTTPDAAYSFTPAAVHSIRGPPPDWPGLSDTQPSILLTTQRLRI